MFARRFAPSGPFTPMVLIDYFPLRAFFFVAGRLARFAPGAFLVGRFALDFLLAAFLAGAFLAEAFLAAALLLEVFLPTDFFAVGFLAADFFAAGFFAGCNDARVLGADADLPAAFELT